MIRTVINKNVIPKSKPRRGRKGYGDLLVLRLLIYAILTMKFTSKGLNRHLKQHPRIARILGFKTIPHRTTISRWWKCKEELLQETISAIGDFIQFFVTNTLAIFDTTPMEDEQDPDAKVGRSSRGYFTGFKLHAVVNQLRIPLRVEFTPGNLHGSPCLRKLGCGLKALFGLADAEYDAKLNEKFLKDQGIIPVIAKNPRNSKQKPRRPRYHILLKHPLVFG